GGERRADRGGFPASDRRDDGDLVTVLEQALPPLEEPDVFLVHVDVDELPEVPGLVAEPLADPGKLPLEVVDDLADVLAFGVDLSRPARMPAEGCGNSDQHRHPRTLLSAW